MNTHQCNLCDSRIYPYSPNPDEIIWMCENEDWLFPFNEEPETLKEVCTFRPKLSPGSLIKQVHLLQEGKLSSDEGQDWGRDLADKIEVQSDIKEHMCKIQKLLTNYQQVDEASYNYDLYNTIHQWEVRDPLDHLLNSEEFCGESPHVEMSVGSEPIFKIEKVGRRPFSNHLSYTDLDSASDKISACASFEEDYSELAQDAEMELEQPSFTLDDPSEKEYGNPQKTTPQWEESNPTYSCTHSLIG